MSAEEIIKIINSCEELILPNGATGAIWKEEFIEKITQWESDNHG